MAEQRRVNRVAERMRAELSVALRQELRDPRLARIFFTRVEMPDDLQLARVFFRLEPAQLDRESTPAELAAEQKTAMAGLRAATGRLRRLMGTKLGLRYTPDIRFQFDAKPEAGSRVEELLIEIEREKPN